MVPLSVGFVKLPVSWISDGIVEFALRFVDYIGSRSTATLLCFTYSRVLPAPGYSNLIFATWNWTFISCIARAAAIPVLHQSLLPDCVNLPFGNKLTRGWRSLLATSSRLTPIVASYSWEC